MTGGSHSFVAAVALATSAAPIGRLSQCFAWTMTRRFGRHPYRLGVPVPTKDLGRSGGLRPLLPSQNVGDHEQQPPFLLTNFRGLVPLLSSERFSNLSPRQQRAPISVIRIRVKGVTGPNALSETRIRTVAQLVHSRTGLDIDITAGSSPTPLTIRLPQGKHGRPALT